MDRKGIVKLNRVASWLLAVTSFVLFTSGYVMTRLPVDRNLLTLIHTNLCIMFTVIFLIHFYISVFIIRYPWRRTLSNVVKGRTSSWTWIKLTQRTSAWLLLLGGGVLIITGLGWYGLLRSVPFSQHRTYDVLAGISLVIHLASGAKSALSRRHIEGKTINMILILVALILTAGVMYADSQLGKGRGGGNVNLNNNPNQGNPLNGTLPTQTGGIYIGDNYHEFNPKQINTSRPDIFQPGYFSVFDVLIHLSEQGKLELSYHFEEDLDTHVIDSLNGEAHWWFDAYYRGGWTENHVHRFDFYPWKDGTTVYFYTVSAFRTDNAIRIWQEEVNRTRENGGSIIIPAVLLDGKSFSLDFEDVEVTPHNMRSDILQNGTITALDVVLSLGDQGLIDYDLKWYEEIGRAEIVKSYWVETIDSDTSFGRCGFVYETGDSTLKGFQGNHIHIPSDVRVINSPDYVWYFWICI